MSELYKVLLAAEEAEDHVHTVERWYGSLAGVNRVAGENLTAFRVTSGNNVYGVDTQILDSADTPILAGRVAFDLHRVLFIAASSNTVYRVQIVWGLSAAAGRAAGTYTEWMYMNDAGAARRVPIDIRMKRVAAGTKAWARCWNATNLATIDFFFGLHEYEQVADDD